jgi:hypothetical protein
MIFSDENAIALPSKKLKWNEAKLRLIHRCRRR